MFDPLTGLDIRSISLVRDDSYEVRLQVVQNKGATISESTLQASTRTVDLSDYSGTPAFGLKTLANRDADGDYSQSWGGYQSSSSWHSLANGRASMYIAPTITPSTYVFDQQLAKGSGAAFTVPGGIGYAVVQRDVTIGNEASAPSGVGLNYGTTTITAGNTSVSVSYTGMAASGLVIPSLLGVSEGTTIWATPASGSFTINIGATYAASVTVGYYVARVSS